jgi:hypothetical protein
MEGNFGRGYGPPRIVMSEGRGGGGGEEEEEEEEIFHVANCKISERQK